MTYTELKNRQQSEFNAFPCFFAFSNQQFDDGMRRLGLSPDDTSAIYHGFGGMYYRRSDSKKLSEMFSRFDAELSAALNDYDFAVDAFQTEIANHECHYTGSVGEALAALALDADTVNSSPVLRRALAAAWTAGEA